jgi:hypothetical protein
MLFSLGLALSGSASAVTVADVTFADRLEVNNQQLYLDGAGLLRWKGIFKVYVAGFYRETPDLGFALDTDESQVLEIEYLRDVSAEGFVKATVEGLEQTLPANEALAQWEADLSPFLSAYQDVSKGDRYRLSVFEDRFELALNGQRLVSIENPDLGRRLLGVWLGDRSPAQSLRDALLAKN